MFAVTGITGQVGAVVGAKLLERGLPVRACMRNADKAGSWRDRGAEIAIAEMTDAAALGAAFAGAEAVFLSIPPAFDPASGFPVAKIIIEALKTALVKAAPKKVVCLSTIGAQAKEENLLTQLGLVEKALSALPMPIAFLRAGWFMENSAWDIAAAREGVMPSFLQPLDKPVPMVGVRDVGAVAAEMLQANWTGKRIIELEGHYRITPLQMAKTFATVLGRPVHAEKVDRDAWEALFRSQGMQNPGPRMRMLDGFNEGWIEFDGGEAGSRKGETTFETAIRALVESGR
ncbi:NmrA family NAD(P)-binding protein [Rhizobium hidalgonense]|uniref:NmrA family NAD(P)-binding protein n=1 Tax=Rhizobium hidalgonense TaxID=1538159 RepID=A0A2A6KAI0_9HYPH|nr:NmrA family NAD(P)-binding protein [Rhizobium hidalgonense]MDR9776905.1 NmrA family NAD(P)-binding protein [Rhizobium hidalgonense]MDR9813948.1 NmrA family NAD(P)-binding protein [Rhizobium hidalgonense]MDR9820734.1 NmrA family NAD(P)-binding protein [Rhizobium hidalgonense]PDT21422.1 NmrA family transcriptional regulator [Rhizobium hidalgonense]PON08080.1 NmrA family transcriptional regulator [Rhizobium hidalgonense]